MYMWSRVTPRKSRPVRVRLGKVVCACGEVACRRPRAVVCTAGPRWKNSHLQRAYTVPNLTYIYIYYVYTNFCFRKLSRARPSLITCCGLAVFFVLITHPVCSVRASRTTTPRTGPPPSLILSAKRRRRRRRIYAIYQRGPCRHVYNI